MPAVWGVQRYRDWLRFRAVAVGQEWRRTAILRDIGELRGKDLACWCVDWDPNEHPAPGVCHAEVLLELANK